MNSADSNSITPPPVYSDPMTTLTEKFDTRPQALALWRYAGNKLGFDFIPNDTPDFLVIRDALKEAKDDSLRAVCDSALELWQGVVRRYMARLLPEDLSVVRSVLCADVEDQPQPEEPEEPQGSEERPSLPTTTLNPGDSLAVELEDQPFPHRLWLVASIDSETGVITTRSKERLAPDDGALRVRKYGTDGVQAQGARPMRWHSPPTAEHIARKNAEEAFLDAWVGLKAVTQELERVWDDSSADLFDAVVVTLIKLGMLANSEEDVSQSEWDAVLAHVASVSAGLEKLDEPSFRRATDIADELRIAGLTIRNKRQSMAHAHAKKG